MLKCCVNIKKIVFPQETCNVTYITHLVQHSQVNILHCVTGAGIKMDQTNPEPELKVVFTPDCVLETPR